MKLSHEVPICLLEDSLDFNDYQYCLPHLLDKDEDYKNFFYKVKKDGVYTIMDNSLHELGVAYGEDRLLYWIDELQPNEFIVPDVWQDTNASIVNARKWAQIELPKGVTKVAVVQAQNFLDAVLCYQTYKDLGYKKIAFSYGAEYYLDHSNHPNKNIAKALGRIEVVSRMYSIGLIVNNDRVHLLGCQVPQEFSFYKNMPFIETIDTSNPIMAAIEGTLYEPYGLDQKPKTKIDDVIDSEFDNTQIGKVDFNTKNFKKINNIK